MSLHLALTLGVFVLAFAGLALGVIFTDKKELRGSCGGPDANPECCQVCPEKDACDDLHAHDVPKIAVPEVPQRSSPAALAQAPDV